jgi:putative nucleic acid binding protein
MKKYIIIISTLVLAAVAIYGLYLYNKPHQSVEKEKAAYSLSAEELYARFESNEEEANKTYLGKVIRVHGQISSLANYAPGKTNIYLSTGSINSVSCRPEEKSEKKVESLLPGDSVTLKGVCTGMLMDVVLVDCVIENN